MKKTINLVAFITVMLLAVSMLASCGAPENVWDSATYKEDVTLGNGEKSVVVEVKVDEHLVTITILTNKNTVGDALMEHGLIEGEEGMYGLYVKKVNGMRADYDKDQRYWAFYIDGEYAQTGVDMTEIEEGKIYGLEYAK